jgi:hypothetical protein
MRSSVRLRVHVGPMIWPLAWEEHGNENARVLCGLQELFSTQTIDYKVVNLISTCDCLQDSRDSCTFCTGRDLMKVRETLTGVSRRAWRPCWGCVEGFRRRCRKCYCNGKIH